MYKKFVSFTYVMNVIFEALFILAFPIGLGILGAWLLVSKVGIGEWIFVPLILLGVASGFISMCRFIPRVMAGIDRMEKERERQSNDNGRNGS